MSQYDSPSINVTPPKGDPGASELLAALTLRTLTSLECDRVGEIICKLDRLTDLVLRTFQAEMAKIDSETNDLGRQIEEIVKGLPNADEAKRLRTLAARLNAVGRTNISIPSPETQTEGANYGT